MGSVSEDIAGPDLQPIHAFGRLEVGRRLNNIAYRREQLERLHQALTREADVLCEALLEDSKSTGYYHVSPSEVQIQLFYAAQAVSHFLERGLDKRRIGMGLVVVLPTLHTKLYSIICAVAGAIAAGNSVFIEVR